LHARNLQFSRALKFRGLDICIDVLQDDENSSHCLHFRQFLHKLECTGQAFSGSLERLSKPLPSKQEPFFKAILQEAPLKMVKSLNPLIGLPLTRDKGTVV
jgi:hypothetical protein